MSTPWRDLSRLRNGCSLVCKFDGLGCYDLKMIADYWAVVSQRSPTVSSEVVVRVCLVQNSTPMLDCHCCLGSGVPFDSS